jgi:Holliday junction resolvasome RuvABC DNA-binding subunit
MHSSSVSKKELASKVIATIQEALSQDTISVTVDEATRKRINKIAAKTVRKIAKELAVKLKKTDKKKKDTSAQTSTASTKPDRKAAPKAKKEGNNKAQEQVSL